MTQLTPYQQGQQQGNWSLEKFRDSGWESASLALSMAEKNYLEGHRKSFDWLDQAKASAQREFLLGLIVEERATLNALIDQGY